MPTTSELTARRVYRLTSFQTCQEVKYRAKYYVQVAVRKLSTDKYFVAAVLVPKPQRSTLPEEVLSQRNTGILLGDSPATVEYTGSLSGTIRPNTYNRFR